MGHMKNHTRWFNQLTNNASGRAAADRAGFNPATLNRQLKRNELATEVVIQLARAYGRPPVRALLETGYLRIEETGTLTRAELAAALSDQELIAQIARRIDDDPSHWEGTFDEVIEPGLRAVSDQPEPAPGVKSVDYAANRRVPEPEEGDDDYGPGA